MSKRLRTASTKCSSAATNDLALTASIRGAVEADVGRAGTTADADAGAADTGDASTLTMRVVRTTEISCSMSRFAAIARATTAANATPRCAPMLHRQFSENARNRTGLICDSQGL